MPDGEPGNAITIRRIRSSDRPEWLRMRTALWPECPNDHAGEIDTLLSKSSESHAVFVSARDDGHLCGFLEAGLRPYAEGCRSSPVAYIEGWWVDPDSRQAGHGAALVAAAEEWARSQGMTEIASDAELANTRSQDAHRALGYDETYRLVCFRKSLQGLLKP